MWSTACSLSGAQENRPKEDSPGPQLLHTEIHVNENTQRVILRKQEPPSRAEINARTAARSLQGNPQSGLAPQASAKPSAPPYVVVTTPAGGGITVIKWSSHDRGKVREHVAFSNIDWNLMTSMHNLEGVNQLFTFMLLNTTAPESSDEAGGAKIPKSAPSLPSFQEKGAQFVLQGADAAENSDARNFMESVHSYFDKNVQVLTADRKTQEYQKLLSQNESRIKAIQPKDVQIRYWVELKPKK